MDLNESIKLAVKGCGVELYDIITTKENDRDILRVYITAQGGVNLDQCAQVSHMISPLLDIHEPMNGKYFLEVSSPGIERKLKNINHFKASIGEKVKVKEYSTEVFKGVLKNVSDEGILTIDDINVGEVEVKLEDVLNASTYFEW